MTVIDNPSELTEQMFAAVGRAMTQWGLVEEQLSRLMAVCIGSAVLKRAEDIDYIEVWHAMWIYFAIDNFHSRLQLVDASLTAHLYRSKIAAELTGEWNLLAKKARQLARRRGKLAHGTVLPAERNLTGTAEPFLPARLVPTIGSPKYYREKAGVSPVAGNSLSTVQVGHLEKAFCLLSNKVRDFTHKVAGTKELRDKVARRALDRLLLAGRVSQSLREELIRAFPSQE